MNISDFKSKLQFGGARPNLFRIIMTFPSLLSTATTSEEMAFLCKAAQLPSSSVGVIPVPFMGREFKVAGDRTYEEWNVTVYNDNDFLIRDTMERWMDKINSARGNIGLVAPSGYMVDAFVQQLDRQQNIRKQYRFVDMFPSSVEAIDLNMENTNVIEEFSVTFQYQYWESNTTN